MFNKKRRLSLTVTIVVLSVMFAMIGQVVLAQQDDPADFTVEWPKQTRPAFHATQFMVTGAVPPAIMAGAKILQQGGNATDAGIAIHAAANVTDPALTGLGGDAVMQIYNADQDKVTTIQALGWAPKNATIEYYMTEHGELPSRGPFSVNVPGGFAGWIKALDQYGTMSLAEVFQPAIELAEKGHPIYGGIGDRFSEYPSTTAIWWKEEGKPYDTGDVLIQSDLANTFKKLVAAEQEALASGKSRSEALRAAHDLFYKGEIGKALVDFLNEQGHVWEYEDMAEFEATEKPPITVNYRGIYDVYQNPPCTQGHITLQALNILEGYDLKTMGHGADYYHLLTETLKLCLRDRAAFIGDPDFVEVPIEGMLSKEYAAEQRARINPDQAMVWPIEPGDPWKYQTETTSLLPKPKDAALTLAMNNADGSKANIVYDGNTQTFNVVDKNRNVFTNTGSINSGWGSGMVLPGYGFFLNNRFVTYQVDPESPNAIEPHKVVHHTIQSVLIMKDGKPFLVVGTPGGDRQTQGTLQVVLNVIEFGMNIQQAIENARMVNTMMHISRSFPYNVGDTVEMEIIAGIEAIKGMIAKGHKVAIKQPLSIGGNLSGTVIDDGALYGGSDPRRRGYAIGW